MTDYTFYTDVYHGSLIPEEDFPAYLVRADARLNALTYGRYAAPDLPPFTQTRVSLAECAVSDALFTADAISEQTAAGIAEEKVGSHSVTYRDPVTLTDALNAKIRAIVTAYLLTTGLLNRACRMTD